MENSGILPKVCLVCCMLVVLAMLDRTPQVEGLCIFGDDGDCVFPCRCYGSGSQQPCDRYTGKCPFGSSCEKGKPIRYGDWQSDGCQLGNVGLNKPTTSNTVITKTISNYNRPHLWYDTNKTVDGSLTLRVFDGSCAVVYTANKTTLPWIMYDLGKVYLIPKVMLVNTDNSIDSSYLETFYIRVGNTTEIDEDQAVCKKYYAKVRSSAKQTIICDKPLLGRYVSIKKYSERNKVGRLPLCEIIIFGFDAIEVEWDKCYSKSAYGMYCKKCIGTIPPDCLKECPPNSYGPYCEGTCGHCNETEPCDKITGKCKTCELGWRPPKCNEACPNNTYGYGCVHDCGSCKGDGQCDLRSGICSEGCDLWYADEDKHCKMFIEVKNIAFTPNIVFVKETWALLTIKDVVIDKLLQKHYKFKLYYLHENNPLADPQEYTDFIVHFTSDVVKIEIHNLIPHTQYWFIIQVYRQHRNASEPGVKSPTVKLMTLNRNSQSQQHQINVNPADGKPPAPPSIHHHVSTVTIILNLLVVVVLIGVGVGVGVFFLNKYRKNKNECGSLKRRRSQENECYDSQIGIINQLEVNEDSSVYSDLHSDGGA